MNGPVHQRLMCGLEGETLSQQRAWPSDGVLGREQDEHRGCRPCALCSRVTRGRGFTRDLDRGIGWCLVGEHVPRPEAVSWAEGPLGAQTPLCLRCGSQVSAFSFASSSAWMTWRRMGQGDEARCGLGGHCAFSAELRAHPTPTFISCPSRVLHWLVA